MGFGFWVLGLERSSLVDGAKTIISPGNIAHTAREAKQSELVLLNSQQTVLEFRVWGLGFRVWSSGR